MLLFVNAVFFHEGNHGNCFKFIVVALLYSSDVSVAIIKNVTRMVLLS
jgi:hypothetical protein